ncbi:hypothetical protein S40293_02603 [Stachybotrys chartarum IBT 40293]|nr:hypothetical protein S40293_02603 [Stachybotrys chartarum IBT 40293]
MDLDDFPDDGIDDLSDSDLQAIDQLAVHFTQQPPQHTQAISQAPAPQKNQGYNEYAWEEDDELDTTEVTNDAGGPVGRPVLNQQYQHQSQSQVPQRPVPPPPNPRWNPAVPAADRPGAGLAALNPLAGIGQGSQRLQAQPSMPASTGFGRPQPSQFARPPLPQDRFAPSQSSQAHSSNMLTALQKRVRALEAELATARSEVLIVRNNSIKADKQHAADIQRIKRDNAEELAKREKVAEALAAASKHVSTEIEFLQQDLREANDLVRSRGSAKPTRNNTAPGPGTPKKTGKTWGLADGFDDMDVVTSPSKGQGRTRSAGPIALSVGERTPSKGKRKRPLVESPVTALETHTGDVVMMDDVHPSLPPAQTTVVIALAAPSFDFLPLVLDHGAFPHQPPTFDILSRMAFPSDPGTSLASRIFQRLPLLGNPHLPLQLLVDFSEVIINLWTRCYEEDYLEPVKYLLSLVTFVFQLQATSVAPLLAPTLVPLVQVMVSTLLETQLRVPESELQKNSEYTFLEEHINMMDMLSLLEMVAMACATTASDADPSIFYGAEEFWKLIQLRPVSLLLAPKQKHEYTVSMLHLLALSSLRTSIGPITTERDPESVAQIIIERVSARLTDFSRTTTPGQKREIRFAALRALMAFARYPFGAVQLATHAGALPRLVTCLSNCIDELYNQPVPSSIFAPVTEKDGLADLFVKSTSSSSADLCQLITQCFLLIYKLVTDPATADISDISQKLSVSYGGSQRYLLALGRLTFAEEDLVMEAGIDSDIVEAAHELLEMAVTPDEGEMVSEAFGEA